MKAEYKLPPEGRTTNMHAPAGNFMAHGGYHIQVETAGCVKE